VPDFAIVSIVSNKGGCGKSMVSSNIAYQLKRQGVRVGILDADVDSPYLSEMVGAAGKITLDSQRRMVPVLHRGVPLVSFSLWLPDAFAGATMAGSSHERWITDAIEHTAWGNIDMLIVDLPAGTSLDEYVLVKRVGGKRFLGVIAVAIPNVPSGLLRVHGTASFQAIRILGVIENMSGDVFGRGSIAAFCKSKSLRFLGSIPLDARIRERHERHEPDVPEDLREPIRNAAAVIIESAKIKAVAR